MIGNNHETRLALHILDIYINPIREGGGGKFTPNQKKPFAILFWGVRLKFPSGIVNQIYPRCEKPKKNKKLMGHMTPL